MKNKNIISARQLMNNSVTNMKNESIGRIEEIMIDSVSGNVAYAVLSFGGFLGFGDKYFAIPWERLTVYADDVFRLDISKEVLEESPGFDKNDWPDFADARFLDSLQEYYASSTDPVETRYGDFEKKHGTNLNERRPENKSDFFRDF